MNLLIQGCLRNDRDSQRLLYQHYYAYAFSICIRYSRNKEEAKEVVNDGFMKVFSKINLYNPDMPFKGWIRKIMIHASIDQYRKEIKFQYHIDVQNIDIRFITTSAVEDLTHDELITMVQKLSPSYRAVFNLFVIDGYSHLEISKILKISVGTSKSNLLKARECLRFMIESMNRIPHEKANG